MSKPNNASQIYGYIVCLVAIIVVIISIEELVGAISDSMDIAHVKDSPKVLSQSFEVWRSYEYNFLRMSLKDVPASFVDKYPVPDEQALRQMYESEKQIAEQTIQHKNRTSLVQSVSLILVSLIIFIVHWIFVRRIIKQSQNGTA